MARCAFGWCWLLAALPAPLFGATSITGPVAGYIAESPGPVLRAILGVPGSFRFSDPLPLPDGITQVYVAPSQEFALAGAADGVAVLSLAGGTVARVTGVDGAIAPDWTAFSPRSGSAVLFSAAAGRLQVLTGLPDAPRVALDIDATLLADTPRAAAASDDATTVLVASRRGVYRLPLDGRAAQLLMAGQEIAALALFPSDTDAAVWDGGTGSIHLLQNVSFAPIARVVASGLKGIGKLHPSWDGGTLFVLRSGTKTLSAIDLAAGEIQSFDSVVAPVTLDPLRNHDTFLISAGRNQPAWIFYRDGSAGRVVFVPAVTPVRYTAPGPPGPSRLATESGQ